jgi:hypothetical protein
MTVAPPTYSLVGSCVTRDAADLGREPLPPPVHFFSRTRVQSLVSAPTPIDPGEVALDSAFQRRVIEEDHRKTAADVLPDLDHPVVIDLIDERSPLVRTGSGIVTASSYFKRTRLAKRKGTTPVPEDRDLAEHGPFATACRRLASLLPQQPVVVHRAYWAVRDVAGRPLAEAERGRAVNHWLERAYTTLESALGDRAVRVEPDPGLLVAEPGHRWGLAPFHYVEDYYDDLSSRLREALPGPVGLG